MIFHQGKDPSIITEHPVSFRSEVFTALNMDKFDLHLKVKEQVEEFQNGSGWVLNHFINMDIGKSHSIHYITKFMFCI